jgi:hypothetical protein
MYILFEKLEALPSGNIVCFVKPGVSQKGPPPLGDQFRGEAIVELSRFHTAFVLDRVNFWGCHTLKMRVKWVGGLAQDEMPDGSCRGICPCYTNVSSSYLRRRCSELSD